MTDTARMALPKKLVLHMEQNDIESAVCNSRQHCAIAQTIYRELKEPVGRVRVSVSGVSIAKQDYRYYYRVPHQACRLVFDFDAGKEVRPITFTLRFTERRKIQRVPDERKRQVNEARRKRTAALAEMGQRPKTYPKGRYGI